MKVTPSHRYPFEPRGRGVVQRMADTVQYILEESIPELEDYEKKGYFTKSELRKIIQKRQDFEYRLKRRAAMKVDYYRCDSDAAAAPSSCNADGNSLRYIEYETKLEELRKHRKKKIPGLKGEWGNAPCNLHG